MGTVRNGVVQLYNDKYIKRVSNKFWNYTITDDYSDAKKYSSYKEAQNDLMTISNIDGRLVDGRFINKDNRQ